MNRLLVETSHWQPVLLVFKPARCNESPHARLSCVRSGIVGLGDPAFGWLDRARDP